MAACVVFAAMGIVIPNMCTTVWIHDVRDDPADYPLRGIAGYTLLIVAVSRIGTWLRASLVSLRRDVPFLLRGIPSGMIAFLITPILLVSLLLGVGIMLLPTVGRILRWRANAERRRVARYTGVQIPEYYPPLEGNYFGQLSNLLSDSTVRRDLTWLIVHAPTGFLFGFLAIAMPLSVPNYFAIPFYWSFLPADEPVTPLVYPITSWGTALTMPLLGVGWAVLTLVLVPRFARWQANWAMALLSPPDGVDLSRRVEELTASRAAALEAHGAELRRIERNLHDGTQNRLVAVVMQLGIAERAFRRNPEGALPLILKAQNAASDALAELRGVVRSIYPPVLTERGLDGAVDALVAGCSVPCTLTVDSLRRAPAAVESAAYFVIAEALTNVAKHSGADQAEVRLSMRGADVLVIEVIDDGHGGADEGGGSGLLGIRRRVAAFDGVFSLTSPAGGPTSLRVELPCGS
jgi:signal transduction histidine kinase